MPRGGATHHNSQIKNLRRCAHEKAGGAIVTHVAGLLDAVGLTCWRHQAGELGCFVEKYSCLQTNAHGNKPVGAVWLNMLDHESNAFSGLRA